MKLRCFLTFVLFLMAVPYSVDGAEFELSPVVVTGDPAPEGGVFAQVSAFSMNKLGAVAFSGLVQDGRSIYAVQDGTIARIIKGGDPIFTCSGPTLVLEFIPLFGELVLINDRQDIVFTGRSFGDFPFLFSGGILSHPVDCVTSLLREITGDNRARVSQILPSLLSNNGTVVLDLTTIEDGRFNRRFFLVNGGIATHLPLVGTAAPDGRAITVANVRDINDAEEILVNFAVSGASGLFIQSGGSRIPVAVSGEPVVEGKTFTPSFGQSAMNNSGEVVFIAELSDFSRSIFHRAPDGTLTRLFTDGELIPGSGGFFSLLRDVEINDRGDIAFSDTNGVYFLSAGGTPSTVARRFDPTPAGGTFSSIFFFTLNLNNKGEIAFSASISTGQTGIFLANAGPGVEMEFVDPIPDLSAEDKVTSDVTELAKMGRVVTGIAADGAARVVVRVKAEQPGRVDFSLVDESGLVIQPSNLNGFLSEVSDTEGSNTVSDETVDVEGVGSMAFATYHAPMDFAGSADSHEADLKEREISIKVTLTTETGETMESTEPIRIVRPPVVLVHGLWASEDAWNDFAPLFVKSGDAPPIVDKRFSVERIDYSGTNATGIVTNSVDVLSQLPDLITKKYKIKEEVAAVQADVVTHSMGGLLARRLPVFDSAFFRNDNFGMGDIHKLINIGTPHFGSPLARFLRRKPCISQFFTDNGAPTNQGAVRDLVPNSEALNQINGLASPLRLHQIVGLAREEDKEATESSPVFRYLRLVKCRRELSNLPPGAFFDNVLRAVAHDLIVPSSSQRAGATGNATAFVGLIHSPVPFFFVGTGELESADISQRVIRLLNGRVDGAEFAPF